MYSWQGITTRLIPLLLVSATVLTAGCGGGGYFGSDDVTVTTGGSGGNDSLTRASITPTPGSVYIGTSTAFQVAWSGISSAPNKFTTTLSHYREPIGGESSVALDAQKISVNQTDSATWQIKRRDNFDLDGDGVYILSLSLPGNIQSYRTFITGTDRSFPAADKTRSASDTPGTGGSLSGLQISPAPGATFIPKKTTFQLTWNSSTPLPSNFQVALWRYKEKRGTDRGSLNEQKVYLTRQGSSYTWNLGRTDNFTLDNAGAYYVEVTDLSTGSAYRAAYIVADESDGQS